MRYDVLMARMERARRQIRRCVEALHPEGGELPSPPSAYRDPQERALFEFEAIAERLEAALSSRGAEKDALAAAVGEQAARALEEAGYGNPAEVRAADDDELLAVEGVGPATLRRLREAFGRA